ncbi:hypothetical protein RB594_009254 [Gaeumannomyces avenae]
MRLSMAPAPGPAALLLVLAALAAADPDKTTTTAEPCTATSTVGFHDLRKDTAVAPPEHGAKPKSGVPTADYFARGWDHPANFTLNICAPVVKPVKDVVGLEDSAAWKNVSAHYELEGKVYSLGQASSVLTPRGRKVSLQYTGGSPCGDDAKARDKRAPSSVHSGAAHQGFDDEAAAEAARRDRLRQSEASRERRKSATLSFVCDHDMVGEKAAVSYIGSSPDGCAYFFDVRSSRACAGVEPHPPGSVGPGGLFAIILIIAVMVYVLGGVFYQRTVAHARGWRQLPNYSLWAGIWEFLSDMFVAVTSSCSRCLPGRRGYRTISSSPNGRSRNREDENRLIDQLDEEWDD